MSDPRVDRFRSLVEKHPTNEMFRFSLAQALDAAGKTDSAVEHYQICIEAKIDWMLPRILLGKLKLKEGDNSAAKTLFEDALKLAIDQDHEDPAVELTNLLEDLGRSN